MNLFNYVDLPQIPEHLLTHIIDNDGVDRSWHASNNYLWYMCHDELKGWVRQNIGDKISIGKIGLQEMTKDILPHTDTGRAFALNYIVRTGDGILSHYETKNFYNGGFISIDKCKEINRVAVEPFKWHMLNTSVLHGVSGIKSSRLALTINVV